MHHIFQLTLSMDIGMNIRRNLQLKILDILNAIEPATSADIKRVLQNGSGGNTSIIKISIILDRLEYKGLVEHERAVSNHGKKIKLYRISIDGRNGLWQSIQSGREFTMT